MLIRGALVLTLAAAMLSSGCDDAGVQFAVGPSVVVSRLVSSGIGLRPSLIDPHRVPGAFCPARHPLVAPVSVVLQADHTFDIFLTDVQMRFVDRDGIGGPGLIFTRRQLIDRFGSTHVPVTTVRTFPFSFPFGCGTLASGTLFVTVVVGDGHGREHRHALRASVGAS